MAPPSSDAGFTTSDAVSRAVTTPKRNPAFMSSSANRPRGPLSENSGAPSEDGDGLEDDRVPRGSRLPDRAPVSRVEDRIGVLVQEHFEAFIEKYALQVLLGLFISQSC